MPSFHPSFAACLRAKDFTDPRGQPAPSGQLIVIGVGPEAEAIADACRRYGICVVYKNTRDISRPCMISEELGKLGSII